MSDEEQDDGPTDYSIQVNDQELNFASVLPNAQCHVLGYAVQIKVLDQNGNVVLIHGVSSDITVWEAKGMTGAAEEHYSRMLAALGQ